MQLPPRQERQSPQASQHSSRETQRLPQAFEFGRIPQLPPRHS